MATFAMLLAAGGAVVGQLESRVEAGGTAIKAAAKTFVVPACKALASQVAAAAAGGKDAPIIRLSLRGVRRPADGEAGVLVVVEPQKGVALKGQIGHVATVRFFSTRVGERATCLFEINPALEDLRTAGRLTDPARLRVALAVEAADGRAAPEIAFDGLTLEAVPAK